MTPEAAQQCLHLLTEDILLRLQFIEDVGPHNEETWANYKLLLELLLILRGASSFEAGENLKRAEELISPGKRPYFWAEPQFDRSLFSSLRKVVLSPMEELALLAF